jgi:hypothetical protein
MGVALISGLAVSGAEGLSTADAGARVSEALHNWKWTIGLVTLVMLIVADRMHIAWRRRYLRTEYRSAYHPTKMRPPARKTLAVGQAG